MVKRHPMIAFFVLAYAFSWWPWILYALGVIDNPIAGFGPFLAAAGPRPDRGSSRVQDAAAPDGPVARRTGLVRRGPAAGRGNRPFATVLNVTLRAETPTPAELGRWTGIFSTFAILLLVLVSVVRGRSRAGAGTPCRGCRRAGRPGFRTAARRPDRRLASPLDRRRSGALRGRRLDHGRDDRDQLAVQPRPRQCAVDHDPAYREQRDLRQLLLTDVHRRRLGPSGLAAGGGLVCAGRHRGPGRRASDLSRSRPRQVEPACGRQ